MTNEEAREVLQKQIEIYGQEYDEEGIVALNVAIKALEQPLIDKFAMMHEIYMKGVNMTGEYQGCWVRFKDIEKIVFKYMAESEDKG